MKTTKGFVDLGLTVILGWGIVAGVSLFGLVYDETQTRKICARGGVVQIGESLFECKKTQSLGDKPIVIEKVVEKIVEKPVPKKCPKCKPQIPCEVKPGEPKSLMCVEAPK